LCFAIVVLFSSEELNIGPLALWVRVVVPMLLIGGIAGNLFKLKLASHLGWFGIGLFCLAGVISSFPTEDDVLGWTNGSRQVPPKEIAEDFIWGRVLFVIVISIAWCWCYRRLRTVAAK
jgi:hypothetical protein